MVDENLIKELKELRESGGRQPSDALKLYEFIKQLAEENEELTEELEDIDLMTVQLVVTDIDYKYWLQIGEGKVDYGEGDGSNITATLKASQYVFGDLLTKYIEFIDAYKAGDIVAEGRPQDIFKFAKALVFLEKIISSLSSLSHSGILSVCP